MEITVVDAMMGRGKTSAAIRHLKENQDKRFLFVTPYISEVERICKELHFASPSTHDGSKTKSKDLMALLHKGVNIASTHALWSIMCDEALFLAKEQGYHLVIDESPGCLDYVDIHASDMKLLVDYGIISVDKNNGKVVWNEAEYTGGCFGELKKKADNNTLYVLGDEVVEMADPKTFQSFKSVTIMTYMFEHQMMRCYCDIFGLGYKIIGVTKDDEGFKFSDGVDIPEKTNFRSLIKIIGVDTASADRRLNDIGNAESALSVTWYQKRGKKHKDVAQLRNNMRNFYERKCRVPVDKRLWTVYANYNTWVTGQRNRYADSFLSCTARATNDFKDATAVAYLVNRYINPNLYNFFYKQNIVIDRDMFALSEMLQWIWRSAIRDGKEITLYIPSKRMRNLLIRWLNDVSGITEEDDIEEEFEFDETMEDGGEVA